MSTVHEHIELAEQELDKAIGRLGKPGMHYTCRNQDYRKLVSISLALRHVRRAITRGEADVQRKQRRAKAAQEKWTTVRDTATGRDYQVAISNGAVIVPSKGDITC